MNPVLENLIRKAKLDIDMLRSMLDLSDATIEMDDDFFYLKTTLFSDKQDYFRFPRELELSDPEKVDAPFAARPDLHDCARARLQEYIPGLEHCTCRLLYGQLLDEERDGGKVFDLSLPTPDSQQVMILMEWPDNKSPAYDTSETGPLAQELGMKYFYRAQAGVNNFVHAGCKYDIMVIPMSNLGHEFCEAVAELYNVRRELMAHSWRDFELERDYYRNKIAGLEPRGMSYIGVGFEYGDDYVSVILHDTARLQELLGNSEPLFCRYWYNYEGMLDMANLSVSMAPLSALVALRDGAD